MHIYYCVYFQVEFPYNLISHLSPSSLIPSSAFPHTLMFMAHLWEWRLRFVESMDAQASVYDVWICNFMSIFSVSLNPRKSCVKSLHYHTFESLVFMNLISSLKEFYIRFVWGIFFKFDSVGKKNFMLYMAIICHVTIWTIYSTFHVSNLS